jgi:hypothetical protein
MIQCDDTLHEEAIYLHQGFTSSREIRLGRKKHLFDIDVDYFTDANVAVS